MHRADRKHVLIFAGGGLEHVSGGVGTLLRYLIDAWSHHAEVRVPMRMPVRVIDTRGAGGMLAGASFYLRACVALLRGRLTGEVACAHIHMTTRGSALRKGVLCAASRALGIPVVLHLHGADFFEFHSALPGVLRAGLRLLVSRAETIVVIGSAWRARLIAEFSVQPGRVRVVPNGVPAAPAAVEDPDVPHILFLGRIGARKGVGDLIDALASPAMAQRRWRATIAGDGELAAYGARLDAAGLQGRVQMPGWQSPEQAATLLAGASILVLPSNHEVMPMAVLEAMARRVAVVTTPVGVIPEILRDGISARLVTPGAPHELAGALADLLDSPAERVRLADAAYQTWAGRLDIAVTAAAIQAVYAEAAGGAGQPLRAGEAVPA